ncbi:ChaN family lipoprotein [Halomonas sp. Bachu 37]|uniref:ChaN family lipoprotein n=1 Tax=Halomonas kashgarensis TaxID=3084920 RepID=UPI003217EB01
MSVALTSLIIILSSAALLLPTPGIADCLAPGRWWNGDDLQPESQTQLYAEATQHEIVLLGEQHDNKAHHRWQLHTLAGLHAHHDELVIGLEMLPREAQPVLDAWVAGELNEKAFLEQSRWHESWGFDPALYLPILHFARMQAIPLVALNISPTLRQRLADGWHQVPADERFGITSPLAASENYRQRLTQVFQHHALAPLDDENHEDRNSEENNSQKENHALERFIQAQLAWDRAMASALADSIEPGVLVVGLMGQGHLLHGDGVPYQLKDLGVEDPLTLRPWDVSECRTPEPGSADLIYTLETSSGASLEPPRLGVMLESDSQGVRILHVEKQSLAEQAGLREGDIITHAAGSRVASPSMLVMIINRQAPGTLLPLEVQRDGATRERLVRFPSS